MNWWLMKALINAFRWSHIHTFRFMIVHDNIQMQKVSTNVRSINNELCIYSDVIIFIWYIEGVIYERENILCKYERKIRSFARRELVLHLNRFIFNFYLIQKLNEIKRNVKRKKICYFCRNPNHFIHHLGINSISNTSFLPGRSWEKGCNTFTGKK